MPGAGDTKMNEQDGRADLPKLRLEETDRDVKEPLAPVRAGLQRRHG